MFEFTYWSLVLNNAFVMSAGMVLGYMWRNDITQIKNRIFNKRK